MEELESQISVKISVRISAMRKFWLLIDVLANASFLRQLTAIIISSSEQLVKPRPESLAIR